MKDSTVITILYQDADWLAVDKPAGLSVHNEEDSTNLLKEISLQLNVSKVLPVHRLDKETSGVQLLSLNENKAAELATQFQSHKIQKFYQGIIAGRLPPQGVWKIPLSDKAEGFKNPAGKTQDQKPCETRFCVLRSSPYFSEIDFEILTGRQHQIRKHCVLSGHALIGDPRYGNPKYNSKIAQMYGFERMALHCREIRLADGKVLLSEAPKEFQLLFPEN